MVIQSQLITRAEALAQLRLRPGVYDDEIDTVLPLAVEAFEREIGHAVIDIEIAGAMPPPVSTKPIYIPHSFVYGVVLGDTGLAGFRSRIGTIIDAVIAAPMNLDEQAQIAIAAIQSDLAITFSYASLTNLAAGLYNVLQDEAYSDNAQVTAALELWNSLSTTGTLRRYRPSIR